MSDRDFAMALAVLAEAFGEKHLTPVRIEAYHRGLKDVPLPLLELAVQRAISTRTYFPKVAELRRDAEACRHALLAAHPFDACESCNGTGWDTVTIDGIICVTRCACYHAHQAKLAGLGIGSGPLALPAGRQRDWTQVGDDDGA